MNQSDPGSVPVRLDVSGWVNDRGLDVATLRGKVVLIEAFQMLCPACVSHAIPQALRLHRTVDHAQLAVLGLHTVFEHHDVMTPAALATFVSEYGIDFPVAIDRHTGDDPIPDTMRRYQLRGTPSTLLIDRAGYLRHSVFGPIDDLALGIRLGRLLAESAPDAG